MAPGSSAEHWGASPTATAVPSVEKELRATTAQSLRGSWKGPTHCCLATRPVTDRSALCTKNRFDPTLGKATIRRYNDRAVTPDGTATGRHTFSFRVADVDRNVFGGSFPRTTSSGKSTTTRSSGEDKEPSPPPRSSMTLTRPSSVTVPTTSRRQFSRSAILRTRSTLSSSSLSKRALDSWYSAPQISTGDIDESPRVNLERW
mmetsp:Transcript_37875/g.121510  ORF Transcript_37875/g.121510 Transcript_37875/m.121510 type:complete len:203 (-) Transcript_37875:1902-2510(-)